MPFPKSASATSRCDAASPGNAVSAFERHAAKTAGASSVQTRGEDARVGGGGRLGVFNSCVSGRTRTARRRSPRPASRTGRPRQPAAAAARWLSERGGDVHERRGPARATTHAPAGLSLYRRALSLVARACLVRGGAPQALEGLRRCSPPAPVHVDHQALRAPPTLVDRIACRVSKSPHRRRRAIPGDKTPVSVPLDGADRPDAVRGVPALTLRHAESSAMGTRRNHRLRGRPVPGVRHVLHQRRREGVEGGAETSAPIRRRASRGDRRDDRFGVGPRPGVAESRSRQ